MTALKVPSDNLLIDNARLQWRNFAGEEKTFNNAGNRNFCIMLDSIEQAEALEAQGWPVKYAKPLEDEDGVPGDPRPFLKVFVKWTARSQPRCKMITSRGMVTLDEPKVFALDYASVEKADVSVRAFKWEWGGKEGVKIMLNSIYVTIREDELERRYADVPEIDMNGNPLHAITSAEDYQNPFAGGLEDLGEIDGQREITSGF